MKNYQYIIIKDLRNVKQRKNKKEIQRTKLFPFETSHPLRSELKDVALLNIPLYKDIYLNIEQTMNIIKML